MIKSKSKIILSKKKPERTQIRISKSLLQELKEFVKDTELETLSNVKLVDIALRFFIKNYSFGNRINHGAPPALISHSRIEEAE